MRLSLALLCLAWPLAAHAAPAEIGKPAASYRGRPLYRVSNAGLQDFVGATQKGYVEVLVPANRGHIYLRRGREVFDFSEDGFRGGDVRPIGGDRYGALIPLSPAEEAQLDTHLARLKRTQGAELGNYDFTGEHGLHCVGWMNKISLGGHGESFVEFLGGKARDAESMPRFANFLVERAKRVEALVLYEAAPKSQPARFQIITSKALERAHAQVR